MASNSVLDKIAKRDLRELYGISHTTLIRWLRRSGLSEFIGRKKFYIQEVVLIFKTLGKPLLARTAAQRLVDLYHEIRGWAKDEVRFRAKYQREKPQVKQEALPKSTEEVDHPAIFTLAFHKTPRWELLDALARLRMVSIDLLGRRALLREKKELAKASAITSSMKKVSVDLAYNVGAQKFDLWSPRRGAYGQKKPEIARFALSG